MRFSFFSVSTALGMALLTLAPVAVRAQDLYVTTNTTLNSNYPNGIVVGKDSTLTVNTSPTVNIVGGTILGGSGTAVDIFNHSTVNITGGTIGTGFAGGNYVNARDQSVVNISGGTLDTVAGFGTSLITVSGTATVLGLESHTGVVTILGGTVSYLEADGGTTNIYGGNFTTAFGYAAALNGGTINLYGMGLSGVQSDNDFLVSGTLQDGTVLNNAIFRGFSGDSSTVHLINGSASAPEPGTLCLVLPALSVGQALYRRKRAQ